MNKYLLKKFPKKRPPLPKKLSKIFNKFYLTNRQNFLSQLSEKWLHYSIKETTSVGSKRESGRQSLQRLDEGSL